MPTYDYECDACGHKFELFQQITAEPEKKCPQCKKNKLRRLFGTGAALVFKGSGFYQTDYRSKAYHDAAAKDKPKSDDSGSKSSSGDSKAAKSESSKSESAKSETKKSAKSGDK